jgi:hypothetical protein
MGKTADWNHFRGVVIFFRDSYPSQWDGALQILLHDVSSSSLHIGTPLIVPFNIYYTSPCFSVSMSSDLIHTVWALLLLSFLVFPDLFSWYKHPCLLFILSPTVDHGSQIVPNPPKRDVLHQVFFIVALLLAMLLLEIKAFVGCFLVNVFCPIKRPPKFKYN